jgi:hypothetical protein
MPRLSAIQWIVIDVEDSRRSQLYGLDECLNARALCFPAYAWENEVIPDSFTSKNLPYLIEVIF